MGRPRIDTAIGGISRKRTDRGFAIYGEVKDDRGNSTRVQRSSAVGGPYCYVFTHDASGQSGQPCAETASGAIGVSPHLTRAQARRLATALLRFADEGKVPRG